MLVNKWFLAAKEIFTVLANITVVIGIVFAYIQIKQQGELEKTRLAFDTVVQLRSPQFISAYEKIFAVYKTNALDKSHPEVTYTSELNVVMNTFNSISLIYSNSLADKCIIKQSVSPLTEEFKPVLEYVLKPYHSNSTKMFREGFDSLVDGLIEPVCPNNK